MGREVVVAITDGKLDFGPWEQIFYGEFDGGRREAGAGQDHRGVITRIDYSSENSSEADVRRRRGSPATP